MKVIVSSARAACTCGLALSLMTCLGLAAVQASPLPALDVAAMTSRSDLIVAGRIDDVHVQGVAPDAALVIWVTVDRVVKAGKASSPRMVRVRISAIEASAANLSKTQYGLFFLRDAPAASYVPTDATYPMLPAVAEDSSGARAGDPLARVIDELAHVLRASVAADDVVQSAQADAAEALHGLATDGAVAALRGVAASGALPGRLWAVAGLFGLDAQSDTANIRVLDAARDSLLAPSPVTRRAALFVAVAMQGRLSSSKAVDVLAALLQSREPAVRSAAAVTLGDLKSARAIEPLRRIALDDEDAEVRASAESGLADLKHER